jgi:hypothetical protein
MKPLENGAFVKEYETQGKEMEQAVQMAVTSIASEDPRYVERVPPPLSDDFPIGTKVFFLGEHAYGTAAQISGATNTSLSVILAVSGSYTYGSLAGCNIFDISISRKTRTKTKGLKCSSGIKPARGITLPTKSQKSSESRGKQSRNSLPGS